MKDTWIIWIQYNYEAVTGKELNDYCETSLFILIYYVFVYIYLLSDISGLIAEYEKDEINWKKLNQNCVWK